MAKKKIILCDTNIVIEALKDTEAVRQQLKQIGNENIAISVITVAELLYGAKDRREFNKIKKYIEYLRILPINNSISEIFIKLINNYSLSHSIGIPDSLIAATSLFYQIEIYTLNTKDFRFIDGLKSYLPN